MSIGKMSNYRQIALLILILLISNPLIADVRRFNFSQIYPGSLPSRTSSCWDGFKNGWACWTYPQRGGWHRDYGDYGPWIFKTLTNSKKSHRLIGDLFFNVKPHDKISISFGNPNYLSGPFISARIGGFLVFPPQEEPVFAGLLSSIGSAGETMIELEIYRNDGSYFKHQVEDFDRNSEFSFLDILQPGDVVSFYHGVRPAPHYDAAIYNFDSAYLETNAIRFDNFIDLDQANNITKGGNTIDLFEDSSCKSMRLSQKPYSFKYGCYYQLNNAWERQETFPVKTVVEKSFNRYCKATGGFVKVTRLSDSHVFEIPLNSTEPTTLAESGKSLGAFTASIENLGVQDPRCSIQLNIQNDIPDAIAYLLNTTEDEIASRLQDMILFKANTIAFLKHEEDLACLIQTAQSDPFYDQNIILTLKSLFFSSFDKEYQPVYCSGSHLLSLGAAVICAEDDSSLLCRNYRAYNNNLDWFKNFLYEVELMLSHTNYVLGNERGQLMDLKALVLNRSDIESELEEGFEHTLHLKMVDHLNQRLNIDPLHQNISESLASDITNSSFLDVWENLKPKPDIPRNEYYYFEGDQINRSNSCATFEYFDNGNNNIDLIAGPPEDAGYGCDAGITVPSELVSKEFTVEIRYKFIKRGGYHPMLDDWTVHRSVTASSTDHLPMTGSGWSTGRSTYSNLDPSHEYRAVIRTMENSLVLIDYIKLIQE